MNTEYLIESAINYFRKRELEIHKNNITVLLEDNKLEEAEQEPEVKAKLAEIRAEYAKLNLEDIRVIDPCMGSGHILVYAFDVLMQIYESAGYGQRDAARSILENNLFGLDIDVSYNTELGIVIDSTQAINSADPDKVDGGDDNE